MPSIKVQGSRLTIAIGAWPSYSHITSSFRDRDYARFPNNKAKFLVYLQAFRSERTYFQSKHSGITHRYRSTVTSTPRKVLHLNVRSCSTELVVALTHHKLQRGVVSANARYYICPGYITAARGPRIHSGIRETLFSFLISDKTLLESLAQAHLPIFSKVEYQRDESRLR